MILSSDLCTVLIKLFLHEDEEIRELAIRAISEVIFILRRNNDIKKKNC